MEKKNSKKPFFASFLEKQINDPEKIQGGGITAPTVDTITVPTRDVVITSQLVDNATLPLRDQVVTMKYPSDSDEGGELEML
ncbi:microviridin/marinostatin family tricyclic proteinase inhibitor [Chryseobacterium herbae]|uniref:Microviridin/marinostatin family tricyclic proteinase inhibitor n=1 Tax=Chryseobacterium herbae TaxID=2976476 RepID=A0ABT2IS48_9FLAO|nr:microviridin/marinostatin family tricyclic proteinase inhibitor [Chryseobacterium sp. pc1-10]MCT2561644.1 microviridin/marinostatin family tricyclic proteinase inhibitor [Chryseobacterium sp. pc1-10]